MGHFGDEISARRRNHQKVGFAAEADMTHL
jgi:hypothetical protein